MTFAVLRALHAIIGGALDDIERVYQRAGQDQETGVTDVGADPEDIGFEPMSRVLPQNSPSSDPVDPTRSEGSLHKTTLSIGSLNLNSRAYVSPPPSPCVATQDQQTQSPPVAPMPSPPFGFPSLDSPCDPTSLSETLTSHPIVMAGINRIIAACGQMTATVQAPFLTICDSTMGYHLPSCMRIIEASHVVEILREHGHNGLHIQSLSDLCGIDASKLAHILRLLATHHIFREVSPDVFALNRISSLIDSGKSIRELNEFQNRRRPELKYQDTNGIAAFVGLCSDEIHKSSAYMTETYLLSPSQKTREGGQPTRAPFCFAFGTVESRTDFFGWLEGEANIHEKANDAEDAGVETGRGAVYPPTAGGSGTTPVATSRSLRKQYQSHKTLGSRSGSESSIVKTSSNPNRFRLERFGKAMSGTGSWEAPGAVFNGFDWNSLPRGSVVVDVGGGIGSTSMLLASAFSSPDDEGRDLKFVIQDRPVVVEMGEKAWRAKCPELLDSGAATFQVHDFFTLQPVRNAAVFLLRVVLHDWPDDFARKILLQLREAATPDTKLLLADFVLPLACPDDTTSSGGLEAVEGAQSVLAPAPLLPNLGKASANVYWMDLTMHVMFNSQERTLREIVLLALSAGWKVIKVTQATGSLFGHITAIPVPVPLNKRARAGSGSAFFDAATASHSLVHSYQANDGATEEGFTTKERQERNDIDFIERAGSRCGTPTFGSRTELSSVEEALARFGGGVRRTRGPGMIGRGLVAPTVSRPKPTIILNPPNVTKKKKPSPLSVPSLASSPSPASPRLLPPPPPKTIKRRVSLAHLNRTPSQQREPVPPLPSPRLQPPATPLAPSHTRPPTLSRRSSYAHLAQVGNEAYPPSPSLIPVRTQLPVDPVSPLSYRHGTSASLSTPRQSNSISRRPSSAQLSQLSLRSRSGCTMGSPIAGSGVGMGIGMTSLLHGLRHDGGGVLRFDKEDPEHSPHTSSPGSPVGGRSVLAAAAKIERGFFSQAPPSP